MLYSNINIYILCMYMYTYMDIIMISLKKRKRERPKFEGEILEEVCMWQSLEGENETEKYYN